MLLPRILQDAGYTTGHFGKWHLTNIMIDDAPLPDQYGFNEFGAFNLPGENMPTTETANRAIDFIRRLIAVNYDLRYNRVLAEFHFKFNYHWNNAGNKKLHS